MTNPIDIWRASFVNRWHMNPDMAHISDPICGHQGRCALLIMALFPDHSADLLRAAIVHDLGESIVGDVSAPQKEKGAKWLQLHAISEQSALDDMGMQIELGSKDSQRLRLVDKLDAYLFAKLRAPQIMGQAGWLSDAGWLDGAASALNVGPIVNAMVLS
jgi:hypothetical protein